MGAWVYRRPFFRRRRRVVLPPTFAPAPPLDLPPGARRLRRASRRSRRRLALLAPSFAPAPAMAPVRLRRVHTARTRPPRRARGLPSAPTPAAPGFGAALRQFMRYRRQQARARRWKPRPYEWLNLEPFVPPVVGVRGYPKGANALAGSDAGDNALAGSSRGG